MTAARVLILVENEPVPSDRHVWNEATALTAAGYAVTVICPAGERRDRRPHERIDGIEVHRYAPRPGGGTVRGYALEYLAALRDMRRLARHLAREQPFAVVHACSPPDFLLLAALGLRARGARLVFDHHDLTPELFLTRFGGGPGHRLSLLAEQVAYRLADVVLAVNDSYRLIALGRGRRQPDDVFVVRTGPDLTRFRPAAPDPALKRGREFLLSYVGVMGPQDGVDQALLALAELRRQRDDWAAIFMGDGSVLDEMRVLAANLGLGDAVAFTGWVEQETIRRVLASSDVCLAPDPSNPLNDVSSMVKLSEYMAMARPIVSYDLAESRIAADGAALFAASGDHAGFACLVSHLLDDPELRHELGRTGRARAERVLAWEHQRRSLLAAYERATAPGPARGGRLAALRRLLHPRRRRGGARPRPGTTPTAAG